MAPSVAGSPGQPQRVMARSQGAPTPAGSQRLQAPTCTVSLGKQKWLPDQSHPFWILPCCSPVSPGLEKTGKAATPVLGGASAKPRPVGVTFRLSDVRSGCRRLCATGVHWGLMNAAWSPSSHTWESLRAGSLLAPTCVALGVGLGSPTGTCCCLYTLLSCSASGSQSAFSTLQVRWYLVF